MALEHRQFTITREFKSVDEVDFVDWVDEVCSLADYGNA
jgi:hypothetical protein